MRRSKGEEKIIDKFDGVNNLIDTVNLPENFVAWAQGGFFSEKRYFRRLPGNLSISTSSVVGPVFSVASLEFRSRTVVVFHASVTVLAETDLTALRVTNSTAQYLDSVVKG